MTSYRVINNFVSPETKQTLFKILWWERNRNKCACISQLVRQQKRTVFNLQSENVSDSSQCNAPCRSSCPRASAKARWRHSLMCSFVSSFFENKKLFPDASNIAGRTLCWISSLMGRQWKWGAEILTYKYFFVTGPCTAKMLKQHKNGKFSRPTQACPINWQQNSESLHHSLADVAVRRWNYGLFRQ